MFSPFFDSHSLLVIQKPFPRFADKTTVMKKIFFVATTVLLVNIASGQTTPLKGVTFGIGLGWNYLVNAPNEYFLSPDANHTLQVQSLSHSSIVISSMINIKLGDLALQNQQKGSTTKQRLVSGKRSVIKKATANDWTSKSFINSAGDPVTPPTQEDAEWYERFAINVGLNIAEVNEGSISFNKAIDGGIGLGYYLNDFTQIGVSFDMIRIRQLRNYIVDNYLDKPIPNGNDVYNALDQNDNNLFYNKYFGGCSVKIIFSLGNK